LIFDSHAHYDDTKFDNDRFDLLSSFPKNQISRVINVGVDLKSSIDSVALAQKYDFIYAAIGIHPQNLNVHENYISDLEKIFYFAKENIVAIGEIGLDYNKIQYNIETQKKFFENQVILAKNLNLPVIVHARDALSDTFDILKKFRPNGIIHCFSGDSEFAQKVIDLNLKIGVGGTITFKNFSDLANVIAEVPIENILLETDAPYLAPAPLRGKRCNSTYIKYTAEKLAQIKKIPIETIFSVTEHNAFEFFKI
jgi:TatD DNase family protein